MLWKNDTDKQNIILKLKKNEFVRIMAFPIVNIIRILRLMNYRFTKESKKMKKLKGSHLGERCFIIGNGPSLTCEDLEKIKDEYCFAANKIYHMFDKTSWRPNSYLCVDSFVYEDIKAFVPKLDLPNIFVHLEAKKYKVENDKLTYINNYYPYLIRQYKRIKNIGFSKDVSKFFVAGETVTYNSIQLAVYMGFKEIYLLGVDHNYSKKMTTCGKIIANNEIKDYFGDLESKSYTIQNYETSTAAYKKARGYCEKHHIVIKNVTRGGKLEVFERATLEEVLKG